MKYTMIMVECGSGWGPSYWIIYPVDGSYISDEVCRLPGGSKITEEAADKVLAAMNNE